LLFLGLSQEERGVEYIHIIAKAKLDLDI